MVLRIVDSTKSEAMTFSQYPALEQLTYLTLAKDPAVPTQQVTQ
jgi:hypothetical protein